MNKKIGEYIELTRSAIGLPLQDHIFFASKIYASDLQALY